jgi:transcriptional regulator with XRE-family HTH domain
MESKAKQSVAPTYVAARVRVVLSPGDAIRIAREVQHLTQAELAERTGLTQSTLSNLEKGRVRLGADRAERLARALEVHPAVLLWPNWERTAVPTKRAGKGAPLARPVRRRPLGRSRRAA